MSKTWKESNDPSSRASHACKEAKSLSFIPQPSQQAQCTYACVCVCVWGVCNSADPLSVARAVTDDSREMMTMMMMMMMIVSIMMMMIMIAPAFPRQTKIALQGATSFNNSREKENEGSMTIMSRCMPRDANSDSPA